MTDENNPSEIVPHIGSNRWSRNFDSCQVCGTTDIAHAGKGFCRSCYNLENEQKQRSHQRLRGIAGKAITKEFLQTEYLENNKSLSDIAKVCNCTRQFVHKKIREFKIESRDKSSARRLAISSQKIKYEKISENGQVEIIVQQRRNVNENFFSTWSKEMSYVLGIIFTDGNLNKKAPIIKIDQKETELLNKVKALMDCDAMLEHRARQKYENTVAGELFSLRLCSQPLYNDLLKIGISPAKSLTMSFPYMPIEVRRHFIRGCWDGDGSVFLDKRSNAIRASFVCGSLGFLEMMAYELSEAGLKARKIYQTQAKNTSYMVRYAGTECEKLYCFLYHKVSPELYLKRKHDVFYDYFGEPGKKKWTLNFDYL